MSNTNLPRVTQKIFAQDATTEIGQFGSAKIGNPLPTGDIEQIQALPAWSQGWDAAVISNRNYPPLEEMTGVQKVLSQQIAYLLEKGVAEWDSGTTYFQNDMARVGIKVYYSTTDNNLENNPETDTTNWTLWNPAEGIYADTDLSNLSEAGEAVLNSKLDDSMVANALLGATNGDITVTDYSNTSYINQGCTVSESNVASGFSASNYILLSKTMTDAVNFTLEIPFNLTSTEGTQYIAQVNNEENAIGVENGFLILTYDGNKETGTIALQPNIDYTLQLVRNAASKTYTLSLKTTGDYTTHITLNSPSGFFAGKSIYLGGGSANFLQGTINLGNVAISADSASYWTISTTSNFQAVTVSGQFNALMSNGRNSDNTLKNENLTLDINKTLIYTPNGKGKTVILKNDGEVMLREYVVSPDEPENLALSGVWYDNVNNVMSEQSILYANLQLVNPSGDAPAITNGILNITADGQYADLAGTFDLGDEWNISLNLTAQPTVNNCYILGDVTVSEDGTVTPSGIALQYNNGNITAYFRRNDVFQVSKTVIVSTAYIVSKDSGLTVGYVAAQGDTGAFVAENTPVYSNQEMTTLLENAGANTWTYSGGTADNTETTTGYVKESSSSSNYVPPSTQVYTDTNCTTPQAVTTGTDYVYDNVSAPSIIGSLSTAYSDTITIGFNGSQYTLGSQTLTSSDNIKGRCNITLGGAPDVSSAITGINLNTSVFSFWKWNGSSLETASYLPFVGAKIGEIRDFNSVITSTKIDMPISLTDTNLSYLTPAGEKHFLNKTQLTNCILEAPNGVATYSGATITLKQGLKFLVPNGRNADGSLKNIEYVLSADTSYNAAVDSPTTYTRNIIIFVGSNNMVVSSLSDNIPLYYQETQPSKFFAGFAYWYNTAENKVYYSNGNSVFTESLAIIIGSYTINSSAITALRTDKAVNLLKYSDLSWLTSLSLPSDKKVTLSIPGSNVTFRAVDDGYVQFHNEPGSEVTSGIFNQNSGLAFYTTAPYYEGFVPVKKGDIVAVYYDKLRDPLLRFIYATGAQE